ncbi:MAG: glycoside hydrolase family 31 protein, partial [Clostridia bacterium]|nr:glycoside hydrolase family 31 protein [Clostridia bacterium]
YTFEGASILDEHLACPLYMDGLTKRDQAWFEHLKKFVDNGASAFKLDGAFQVNDHPDRLWGGKYFDDEIHNLYPVIYVKQMMEGFRDYTDGRRAIIYTPCMYAGSQQYCASWAGDTGGGYDTVVAMLNYGLSGHTNVTADMEATIPEGIHYAFFMPWVQQLGWRNWQQPWFLGDELEEMIKYYSRLRSSLFPYIYSMAYKASTTSMPLARSLSLMYEDKAEYDLVTNCYMFGDSILVGVFDMNVTLPEGKWYDFFTGKIIEGGQVVKYEVPEGRGGALFVKCGAIIPTMEPCDYVEKFTGDKYTINLYHGEDAGFDLYEDDGLTYDYLDGSFATTHMSLTTTDDGQLEFALGKRCGTYEGRERRTGDAYKLSDPDIQGIGDVPELEVILHTAEAEKITQDGKEIDFEVKDGKTRFRITSSCHASDDLVYKIKI